MDLCPANDFYDIEDLAFRKWYFEQRFSSETETQIINNKEAVELREKFQTDWEKEESFTNLQFYDTLPIALITFVLSLLISIDSDCRQSFYTLFQGKKVPAILQFCFETFQAGPISNSGYVSEFYLLEDFNQILSFGLGESLFYWNSMWLYDYKSIYEWFQYLTDHFNSCKEPYMTWVEFKSVSMMSAEKNYLCGLTVQNNEIMVSESSYFHELSEKKKEMYSMLAWVLEAQCIWKGENMEYPHKILCGPTFDEKGTITQLIHFITKDCEKYLLNHSV